MRSRLDLIPIACCSRLPGQAGHARLPLLIALVLAGALLVRLGWGGWALWQPADAGSAGRMEAAPTTAASTQVDLAAIRTMELFTANASPSAAAALVRQPAQPLPALPGSLRLEGVALAADAGRSVAFIRSGGRQQAYRQGDTFADAALSVQLVARDHVILERRGEVLRLNLHDQEAPASAEPPVGGWLAGLAQAAPSINQSNLAEALQAVDEAMNLASLSEIVEIRPAQQNGRLIGYQLSPGLRLRDFVQLGLRTGDIVTAVNGIPLDDMAALQSLSGLLRDATEVSFSLLREGQVQNLRISAQVLAATSRGANNTINNSINNNNTNKMERP